MGMWVGIQLAGLTLVASVLCQPIRPDLVHNGREIQTIVIRTVVGGLIQTGIALIGIQLNLESLSGVAKIIGIAMMGMSIFNLMTKFPLIPVFLIPFRPKLRRNTMRQAPLGYR